MEPRGDPLKRMREFPKTNQEQRTPFLGRMFNWRRFFSISLILPIERLDFRMPFGPEIATQLAI